MRKEIILAIVIGVVVGLSITAGLYLLREKLRPKNAISQIVNNLQQNSPSPSPSAGNLTIQQPKNNLYTKDSSLRIVGRSLAQSYITILTGNNEYITVADQDGDFSQAIDLVPGGNRITIISVSAEGQQEQVVLSAVFSTADLNSAAPPAPSGSPSPSPKVVASPKPKVSPTP